jgi:ribonuclease BN (tRNA processing enzyme)
LVLDAGTGIRCLGQKLLGQVGEVHILLTHLHMDHLQGLPFFAPLRTPGVEVHIWGPASTTLSLSARLQRYLSPPLFPVSVRELPAQLHFHELPGERLANGSQLEIGELRVTAQLVIHPNPTIGYRIEEGNLSLTYLPDHEPALGAWRYPPPREWLSGYEIAAGADVLIHDAQYTPDEYAQRTGFGHSSLQQALQFAETAGVRELIPFHHDPAHSDEMIDALTEQALNEVPVSFALTPGVEGRVVEVGVGEMTLKPGGPAQPPLS